MVVVVVDRLEPWAILGYSLMVVWYVADDVDDDEAQFFLSVSLQLPHTNVLPTIMEQTTQQQAFIASSNCQNEDKTSIGKNHQDH